MIYFIQVITRDILKNEENAVNKEELNNLLENVASGAISPKEAADSIKLESFKDLALPRLIPQGIKTGNVGSYIWQKQD